MDSFFMTSGASPPQEHDRDGAGPDPRSHDEDRLAPLPEALVEALAGLLAEALVRDIRQYPDLAGRL